MSDEGSKEHARLGLEDVNLAVGHPDDDVAVVYGEGSDHSVVGGGVGGEESTASKPVGFCEKKTNETRGGLALFLPFD